MKTEGVITVSAWDETIEQTRIFTGTALTFAIPPHLPYRRIYLYVEPVLSNPVGDYFLKGQVVLTNGGQIVSDLPAGIGRNTGNKAVAKSIPSLFTWQEVVEYADGQPQIGEALAGALRVVLANGFASANNCAVLAGCSVLALANRFAYVITEWSRAVVGQTLEVSGFRAFGLVLSSSSPLT